MIGEDGGRGWHGEALPDEEAKVTGWRVAHPTEGWGFLVWNEEGLVQL